MNVCNLGLLIRNKNTQAFPESFEITILLPNPLNYFSLSPRDLDTYLGSVDKGKNLSQQRGSLLVSQVPIRLTNVWYGRPGGIMDPLPSKSDLNQLSSTK